MILITRPQEDADIFAKELGKLSFQTLCEPMLEIHPLPFETPEISQVSGLIFTSANAVRLFAPQIKQRTIPAYCVGKQTAEAAQEQGFTNVLCAENTDGDLTTLISKNHVPDKPLLHVRGADVTGNIVEGLKLHNIGVETLIIYKAELTKALSPQGTEALRNKTLTAVTFFSRRTAENFMRLTTKEGLLDSLKTTKALCISIGVLECVQPALWQDAYSAETPDRDGMLALAQTYSD